jgi:hypothetical protein
MTKMQAAYEQFRRDGLLPASFEVVYATAWGGTDRPAAAVIGGEARISVDAIRRRL